MEPPHARPTQPRPIGAMIWNAASKSALSATVSGTATRNETPFSFVYEAQLRPVSASVTLCDSAWARAAGRVSDTVACVKGWGQLTCAHEGRRSDGTKYPAHVETVFPSGSVQYRVQNHDRYLT